MALTNATVVPVCAKAVLACETSAEKKYLSYDKDREDTSKAQYLTKKTASKCEI